jgi:hypothetical protein
MVKIRNFIPKHCCYCEYFTIDNKCSLTNLNKSKKSVCKKWKLVKNLR